MPISQEYSWDYIAAGATVGVFIHGYAPNLVGVYNAIPLNVGEGQIGTPPLIDVMLTQGEVSIHVDGTYARTSSVQNLAGLNPVGANLNLLYDFM